MLEYQDIEITCLCGQPFIWTAGEQSFLNDLVLDGKIPSVQQPKRCIPCRKRKKEERESKLRNQPREFQEHF